MRVRVDEKRSVTATIDRPRAFDPAKGTVVVLAHGAGNDMESRFLLAFSRGLRRAGIATVRFNFPYKEAGRKAPDRQPVLEATYRAVLATVRKLLDPARLVIGGKSMGARMASYLAAEGEPIAGLAFLGYPLHPAGKPDKRRDDHFDRIRVPALFLSGDRDALCDLTLLRRSLGSFAGEAQLHVLEGGDHSFRVLRRSGRTDEEALDEAVGVVREWLRRI